MRVALDVSIQGRADPTGVERAQALLIDGLLGLGVDLVLLGGGSGLPARWRAQAVGAAEEGSRAGGPWWRNARLPELLRRSGASVFHSPVAALPLACPVPSVATLHDLPWVRARAPAAGPGCGAGPQHPGPRATTASPAPRAGRRSDPDGGAAPARRLVARLATSLAVRLASRLLVPSRRTADDLLALDPVAAPRVRVVPHGVDPRFSPAAADDGAARALLARLGTPARDTYVLALGRLRRRKNLLALVEAYASLPPALAPAALVLAGPPGDASAELAARARQPDLAGRLVLPGAVDDALLPALVAGARILAAPSLCEGYGLTALEAMAAGTPVLAARQGPVDEVAGGAALRVDGRDVAALAAGLAALLEDRALATRLVAAGRERAAERSVDAMARATVAVYEELA